MRDSRARFEFTQDELVEITVSVSGSWERTRKLIDRGTQDKYLTERRNRLEAILQKISPWILREKKEN